MKDIERNLKALELLKGGEFATAQALLIKNKKLSPSHKSYNNLGRFFAEFGNERKNGKIVRAKKLAFRYLKKSIELNPNIVAYRNLAYFSYELFLYENGRLEDAEKYQAEVLNLEHNCEDIYNFAVILYQAGKYCQGLEILYKIVPHYPEAGLLYLMFLFKLDKLSQDTLKNYREILDTLELFSQQYFYYHCKDYAQVISVTEQYPSDRLEVDKESLAIYVDSLIKVSCAAEIKRQANEICKKIDVKVKDFIELIKSEKKRKSLINQNKISTSMKMPCGFFGCPIHNTEW